jgi:hypothetical protein
MRLTLLVLVALAAMTGCSTKTETRFERPDGTTKVKTTTEPGWK